MIKKPAPGAAQRTWSQMACASRVVNCLLDSSVNLPFCFCFLVSPLLESRFVAL